MSAMILCGHPDCLWFTKIDPTNPEKAHQAERAHRAERHECGCGDFDPVPDEPWVHPVCGGCGHRADEHGGVGGCVALLEDE